MNEIIKQWIRMAGDRRTVIVANEVPKSIADRAVVIVMRRAK